MNNTSRNSNQVNNPSRSSARTRVEYSNVPNNRGDKRTPAGKPSDNRSKKPNIPGTVQKTATSPVRKPATPLKKGTEPISVRIKGERVVPFYKWIRRYCLRKPINLSQNAFGGLFVSNTWPMMYDD